MAFEDIYKRAELGSTKQVTWNGAASPRLIYGGTFFDLDLSTASDRSVANGTTRRVSNQRDQLPLLFAVQVTAACRFRKRIAYAGIPTIPLPWAAAGWTEISRGAFSLPVPSSGNPSARYDWGATANTLRLWESVLTPGQFTDAASANLRLDGMLLSAGPLYPIAVDNDQDNFWNLQPYDGAGVATSGTLFITCVSDPTMIFENNVNVTVP